MFHHHQCPKCGNLWAHNEDDFRGHRDWQAGHTCQNCGHGEVTDKCDERGKLYSCYSDKEWRREVAKRRAELHI